MVIEPQFQQANEFSEGLAAVCVGACVFSKSGGKWGYIDTTGKFVVNPQLDSVEPFRSGVARVFEYIPHDVRAGYVDKS